MPFVIFLAIVAPEYGYVSSVVDGDTIRVETWRKHEIVRYIGMDTPERGQPGGLAAAKRNRELVLGRIVRMERDVRQRDPFGRLLRYVYVDGIMVNAQLITDGHAIPKRYEPDTTNAEYFESLKEVN
jgi:micrococcal nuclease